MKHVLAVSLFAVLAASVAVAQNPYVTKNIQLGPTDITTRTATVNAWKQIGSSCQASTLVSAPGYRACVMNDGYVYAFNMATKAWDKQTAMGLGVVQLAAADPATIFALMSAPQCGNPNMGIFLWTGSAWSQKGGCYAKIAAGTNGATIILAGINNINQMWFSTDEGNSYTIQSSNWISASVGTNGQGCAVDTSHVMWSITSGQIDTTITGITSPNGSVAGCIWADSPTVLVAWTSTGWVYSMPIENYGTWSVVAGIAAQEVVGSGRGYIFAEDTGFKVYHWNVNAPTVSATYGGQWNANNGCPAPGSICHPTTTHTITHQVRFKTGHGLGGQKNSSTQVFTNDIEVTSSDTNPGCDPLFGVPNDVECYAVMSGGAQCNQSNAAIGDEGLNWTVGDSVDVMDYSYNDTSNGPMGVATSPYSGYYIGEVFNVVHDGCAISDPVPVCPASSPLQIWNRVDWLGAPAVEAPAALARWHQLQTTSILGYDGPYVVHGFYLGQADANGNLILGTQQCFGGWLGNQDFLYGKPAPACY